MSGNVMISVAAMDGGEVLEGAAQKKRLKLISQYESP